MNSWLTPNRVTAIATVLAAIGAALSHVTTGDTKIDAIVAVVAFALTHLFAPDGTVQVSERVTRLEQEKK